jgi:hypothetical protein
MKLNDRIWEQQTEPAPVGIIVAQGVRRVEVTVTVAED